MVCLYKIVATIACFFAQKSNRIDVAIHCSCIYSANMCSINTAIAYHLFKRKLKDSLGEEPLAVKIWQTEIVRIQRFSKLRYLWTACWYRAYDLRRRTIDGRFSLRIAIRIALRFTCLFLRR